MRKIGSHWLEFFPRVKLHPCAEEKRSPEPPSTRQKRYTRHLSMDFLLRRPRKLQQNSRFSCIDNFIHWVQDFIFVHSSFSKKKKKSLFDNYFFFFVTAWKCFWALLYPKLQNFVNTFCESRGFQFVFANWINRNKSHIYIYIEAKTVAAEVGSMQLRISLQVREAAPEAGGSGSGASASDSIPPTPPKKKSMWSPLACAFNQLAYSISIWRSLLFSRAQ